MSQVITKTLGKQPCATVSIPPEKVQCEQSPPPTSMKAISPKSPVVHTREKNYEKILSDFLSDDLPTITKPKRPTSSETSRFL